VYLLHFAASGLEKPAGNSSNPDHRFPQRMYEYGTHLQNNFHLVEDNLFPTVVETLYTVSALKDKRPAAG